MKLPTLSLSLFLSVGSGCSRPEPLVGVYAFDSSQVHERIEIKQDGTFVQTIGFSDGTNAFTGTWQLTGKSITFRGFRARYDRERDRLLNPAKEYLAYTGYRDTRGDRIYFDVDNEGKFYVTRMANR